MKSLFTFLLAILGFGSYAQVYFRESFEAPYDLYRDNFEIDTVNYHHNLWQIGRPQKTVFDSSRSYANAIVTDTLNTYPANDTSVFTVRTISLFAHPSVLNINFMFKLDIDSTTIVKMEVSGDNGENWIDPITDDTTYAMYWGFGKPRLDTSTDNWQSYQLNMNIWSTAIPGGATIFPHYHTSDTTLFRFTFISGSDVLGNDGWIMDDFISGSATGEGVTCIAANDKVNIYPNPSTGKIFFNTGDRYTGNELVRVYNISGQEVYNAPLPASKCMTLPLADGVYILKYIGNNGSTATKRIVLKQ